MTNTGREPELGGQADNTPGLPLYHMAKKTGFEWCPNCRMMGDTNPSIHRDFIVWTCCRCSGIEVVYESGEVYRMRYVWNVR